MVSASLDVSGDPPRNRANRHSLFVNLDRNARSRLSPDFSTCGLAARFSHARFFDDSEFLHVRFGETGPDDASRGAFFLSAGASLIYSYQLSTSFRWTPF